ncbi:MAG: 3-methyl-2-oxobutanoate dehydrogenase subunit VorB [Chloroflexota bacterium]
MTRELLKGNLAIAETAIRVGLDAYFGYPITPQTELLEWMSRRMVEEERVFLQAESELAAINMVYGAACTGARVMTSSSGPGISLMMEGISYIAATEVPFVLVDVMRAGPGLGNIDAAQSDYNQIIHGGGHGDYHQIVLAPSTIQESIDYTVLAFDLAEKYRMVTVVLIDGIIGQMMEPGILPEMKPARTKQPDWIPPKWAVRGKEGHDRHLLTSIHMSPTLEEGLNLRLLKQWREIRLKETRYKEYYLDDAEIVVVGFGTAGRVALSAVRTARSYGIKVGLFRPISLRPFPEEALEKLVDQTKAFLVVEMNTGQMYKDIKKIVSNQSRVEFYGRVGGVIPFPDEILSEIRRISSMSYQSENIDPIDAWIQRLEDIRKTEAVGR